MWRLTTAYEEVGIPVWSIGPSSTTRDLTPVVDGKQYNFEGKTRIRCIAREAGGWTNGTSLQGMLPGLTRERFFAFCEAWGLEWTSEPEVDPDYDLHTAFIYLDHVDGCLHCVSIYDRFGHFRVGGHGEAACGIARAMGLFVN